VVVGVASMALKLAQALLPAMDKLVPAGAKLIDGLAGPLTAFASSPFFGQFIDQMSKLAAQVAPLLGQSLTGLLKVFAQLFMQAGPAGVQILNVLLPLFVRLAGDLVPVITVIAKVVAAVLNWLSSTHLLIPVVGLLAGVLVAVLAPGWGLVAAVAALIAVGVELGKHWHQIWGAVHRAVIVVWDWIKSHWPLLLAILTGPVGLAALFITQHWHQITAGAARMFHDVVSFFESLPGRILHALGDLGHLLWDAGKAIINGLIHGIEAQASQLEHTVLSLVDTVKSYLPFSPAKRGPLSGAGSPELSGRSISRMLAAGIAEGAPGVAGVMEGIAGTVAGQRYRGGYGGHGGGGQQPVVIEVRGGGSGLDNLFFTWLMHGIRARGGSPEIIVRKVRWT
jgi:hypothetical protein